MGSGDVERILARVALKSARPRDLSALRETLARLPALSQTLAPLLDNSRETGRLHHLAQAIDSASEATPASYAQTLALLTRAIIDTPPALLRDGGVIADGFDPELDRLRGISSNADGLLLELEARERRRSGLDKLKVGYNRVHGYYIEVSRQHADRVPDDYTRAKAVRRRGA